MDDTDNPNLMLAFVDITQDVAEDYKGMVPENMFEEFCKEYKAVVSYLKHHAKALAKGNECEISYIADMDRLNQILCDALGIEKYGQYDAKNIPYIRTKKNIISQDFLREYARAKIPGNGDETDWLKRALKKHFEVDAACICYMSADSDSLKKKDVHNLQKQILEYSNMEDGDDRTKAASAINERINNVFGIDIHKEGCGGIDISALDENDLLPLQQEMLKHVTSEHEEIEEQKLYFLYPILKQEIKAGESKRKEYDELIPKLAGLMTNANLESFKTDMIKREENFVERVSNGLGEIISPA